MIPILTPGEMAAVDAAAPEPVAVLVARAGWAVARVARQMLGGTYGKRVVVIAGRGNNGADGRVAAELLARRGARVTVVDPTGRPEGVSAGAVDPSADQAPGPLTLPPGDLIIDAAFGTGLSRPYVAPRPADPATPVLAVDIPSGIDGLTGGRVGEPLYADVTVTFAALKPGLLCADGPATSGEVIGVDIGLDTSAARAWQVTGADIADWLPTRARRTHKWRSALRLVAGSPGMTGSADLASAAALRAGSGYVRRSTPGLDPAAPGVVPTGPVEAVTTALGADDWADEVLADLDRFGALAVGPGLGRAPAVAAQIAAVVRTAIPLVIDGDGLRALGDDPAAMLAARPTGAPSAVLTPHDAEFAALGGDVDAPDRFASVRALAARTGAVVLHKGPTTIVADPAGDVLVSTAGDARLATAGTGDVLTGVIGAFLARGVDPFEAAAAAAWVHGTAGRLAPTAGLVASDLPALVATVLAAPDGGPMSEDGPVRTDPTR